MRNVHLCDVSLRVYVPELNRPQLDYAIRDPMRTYGEILQVNKSDLVTLCYSAVASSTSSISRCLYSIMGSLIY
jgi:hypothetical protein